MRDRRYVQDLTIEELETELLIRRREERLARLRRMKSTGRAAKSVVVEDSWLDTAPGVSQGLQVAAASEQSAAVAPDAPLKSTLKRWQDRVLLGVEIAALVGLVVAIISMLVNIRNLNQDWNETQLGQALPTPTSTPLIRASILPGGHKPPTEQGGEPQPLEPLPAMMIPTPGPRAPTRLVVSSINVDVPVVPGDDWEQLKKGAGHHIGSANPGERGNCFISGHNDIYGEIFRDLEYVKIGDEVLVYAGEQSYRYIVRATRIVEPDDVSIMYPTSTPILTLMTCYPYMVDTQRLVVIAELQR